MPEPPIGGILPWFNYPEQAREEWAARKLKEHRIRVMSVGLMRALLELYDEQRQKVYFAGRFPLVYNKN